MQRRDVLAGDGDQIAALTDGLATIDGVERRWSTVGLYDVVDDRIAACRLLPLDQGEFDAIWSGWPKRTTSHQNESAATAARRSPHDANA
jgi:hypothetical protein